MSESEFGGSLFRQYCRRDRLTSHPALSASLLVAVIFHQLFSKVSPSASELPLPSSLNSPPHASASDNEPIDSSEITYISPHEKHLSKLITVLKPILACPFAITTPAGIALDTVIFKAGADACKPVSLARLPNVTNVHDQLKCVSCLMSQGLLSAISAGMLIYAACVEMLTADFVMDPKLWRSGWVRQGVAVGSLVLAEGVCDGGDIVDQVTFRVGIGVVTQLRFLRTRVSPVR